MSLRADTSDPAIRAAYQDVLNNATDTNWYTYTHSLALSLSLSRCVSGC